MPKRRPPFDILRHSSRKPRIARALFSTGLGLLLVLASTAVFSYTRVGERALTRAGMGTRVYAAASTELNFQARLMNNSGAIVPDGNTYSVQFKLYDASSAGTNEWTETQSGLTVKGGYLSVHLGSVTSFPSTIDWSQEHWLTMNVNSDGEMSPRLKLTAVPLAFRAIQADKLTNGSSSLTASDLAQLAPSSIQAVNTALAALRINQQGSGLLAQFQGGGSDVFTIANNGDVTSTGGASFDGNGTFKGGSLTIGSATQLGSLLLQSGNGNKGTVKTAVLGQNTTYTLPDPGGASATICLSTGNCGGTGDISQNGNSFGTTVTIGTNDTQSLVLETHDTPRVKILSTGEVGIGTSSSPSALFSVGGTTGALTVDSSGNLNTTGTLTAGSSGGFSVAASGAITAPTTSNTINGLVISSGALSNITTLNASGLATVVGLSAGSGQISGTGGLSITGTSSINGNAISSTQFTFGGAGTITTSSNGDLTLSPNGSGSLVLNTGSGGTASTNITTLQRIASGGLTFDLKDSSNTTFTLNNSGAGAANLNLNDGGLYTASTQRLSNSGALQNVTGDNSNGVSFDANVITGGTLTAARGGTGVNGSGATNGQLLIGNGSGFTLASLTNSGGLTISNGAGSIGLAVNYGSSSTTAVRGDTGLTCASGTGNLTGGGTNITLGSGGTCAALDTNAAVSFGTSVTTPLLTNSGALGINTSNSTVANTGNITIKSGDASTGSNLSAGTVTLDTGTKTGAGTATINIGNTNATSLVLGNANTSTTLNGTGLTLGSGLSSITRTAAGTTTFNLVDSANTTFAFTNSGAGNLNLSADGTITAGSGLTVSANGASISGGLNNNSGGITNAGSITGVGTNITASAGLTITSGGSGDLSFDSGSNKLVIAGTDTTLQRTGTGSFTIDLNDGSATTLVLNNSGAGAADLNLNDGGLQVAGTSVLTNGAALQNLTGFGQSSGNFAISGTGTFATASGAVGLNGATTISTSANSTTALTVNGTSGTAATAVNIAQTGAAGNLAMTNTAATSQALVSLTQSTSAYTGTGLLINMASGSGSFASGNFLDFQLNGTSRFKVDNTGALTINSNSSNALKITNTSGVSYFNVDATGNQVTVGAADATTVLFVLDSSSTSSDPGVVAGAMYYRTSDNQFRCSTSAAWKDCLTGGEFSATLSANHAITNAGLTDVSGFSYAANNGETWEVEIRGATSGNNTTGDVACDLITTGTWGTGQSYNEGTLYAANGALTNRTATAASSTTTSAGALTVNNGDGVVRPFHLTYRFVMTSTGTVKFQCGNASAAAGRTSTLNSGAMMIARRMD